MCENIPAVLAKEGTRVHLAIGAVHPCRWHNVLGHKIRKLWDGVERFAESEIVLPTQHVLRPMPTAAEVAKGASETGRV